MVEKQDINDENRPEVPGAETQQALSSVCSLCDSALICTVRMIIPGLDGVTGAWFHWAEEYLLLAAVHLKTLAYSTVSQAGPAACPLCGNKSLLLSVVTPETESSPK